MNEGRLSRAQIQGWVANRFYYQKSIPIKDAAIYKAITPTGMNPDGKVNVESLAQDLAFYREQGLIQGEVRLEQLVDHSFVEAALRELGPYKR